MLKTTPIRAARAFALAYLQISSLSGCDAAIQGNAAPGGPAGGGAAGGSGLPPGEQPPTAVACAAGKVTPAPAPLLRLTNQEYLNTVRDLFPGVELPKVSLPVDQKDDGFDTSAAAQAVSAPLVEAYFNYARDVATAATSNLATLLPCAAEATPAEPCGQDFPKQLAEKAYRRPANESELTRLTSLFASAKTSFGVSKAVEVTIRAVLQSPAMLYRPEFGAAQPQDQAGTVSLSPHEMASRLSYLFWDTMPDASLLDAAASGALATREGVEAQAKRMLADPRAKDAVARFHAQWLRFEKMDNLRKSATLFPTFSDATASALRDSTARYVDYLFWKQKKLSAWFTDDHAFVNDQLAPIYGAASPGAELSLATVNAQQRAGILTQAGLLASFAHETSDAPVLRGVFVLSRLLCSAPPPPPPNIPAFVEAMPGDPAKTTRQRLEETHTGAACRACHDSIDGIGFAFEHYDAVGQYRDQDSGLPVDASGELKGTLDSDGSFNGAIELGQRLAQSSQVQACVAKQWTRYALGSTLSEVDTCAVREATERLAASGGDLQELLPALVASDSFRTKTVTPP